MRSTPMGWVVIHATLLVQSRPKKAPNPRPRGTPLPTGATWAALHAMRQDPRRWWRHAELVRDTGRTAKAVDWALLYLRRHGYITAREAQSERGRALLYQVREGRK